MRSTIPRWLGWSAAACLCLLSACEPPPPPPREPVNTSTIDRAEIAIRPQPDEAVPIIQSLLEGMGMVMDKSSGSKIEGFVMAHTPAGTGFRVFLSTPASALGLTIVKVVPDNYLEVELRRSVLDAIENKFH